MYHVLMRAFHHQYICLMHLTHHLFSVPPENEWEVNMRNGGEGGGGGVGGGHGGGIQNLMTFPARISVRVKLLVNITPFALAGNFCHHSNWLSRHHFSKRCSR